MSYAQTENQLAELKFSGMLHAYRELSDNPNWVEQSFDEVLELAVNDNGQRHLLRSTERKYALYPQQFLRLIADHPALEFAGWWNNWNPDQPLDDQTREIYRPIALVRRKEAQ